MKKNIDDYLAPTKTYEQLLKEKEDLAFLKELSSH